MHSEIFQVYHGSGESLSARPAPADQVDGKSSVPLRHWHGPGMLLGSGTALLVDCPLLPTNGACPTNHQSVHHALLQPPIFEPYPHSKLVAMNQQQHDEICLQLDFQLAFSFLT